MDRQGALGHIRAARGGKHGLWREDHFVIRMSERRYTIRDAYNVLDHGAVEEDPSEECPADDDPPEDFPGCKWVRVRGKSLDGRDTRVVVVINLVEDCVLWTIVDLTK